MLTSPVGLAARVPKESPASRQGRDTGGRRRSAAIPPHELSRENVGSIWQNASNYGNMWQQHLKQAMAKCVERLPFCENPACPDPVWKLVKEAAQGRPLSAEENLVKQYIQT